MTTIIPPMPDALREKLRAAISRIGNYDATIDKYQKLAVECPSNDDFWERQAAIYREARYMAFESLCKAISYETFSASQAAANAERTRIEAETPLERENR